MIFHGQQYLKYFKYEGNMRDYSECPPEFQYLKYLPAVDSSFMTIAKPLVNKIGETFCEELI